MSQRKINELVTDVHETAVRAGWWDGGDKNPLEIHALIHSEVSEATEEVRSNHPFLWAKDTELTITKDANIIKELNLKPEGELIELADVVIRCMDYCGQKGWDLNEAIEMKIAFNKTRPHRHGGKKH